MKLSTVPKLLRVHQWYKNLVIFLALCFSNNLFNITDLTLTILGFISLSLAASSGYIINDIKDKKQDQLHPEKRLRPIANKEITSTAAAILSIALLAASLTIAHQLSPLFLLAIAAYYTLTTLYTFLLKHIVVADIITISTLFVIRAMSGAYIINVHVSPWLILCPFFLALMLAAGKRYAELKLLDSTKTRSNNKENITSKSTSSNVEIISGAPLQNKTTKSRPNDLSEQSERTWRRANSASPRVNDLYIANKKKNIIESKETKAEKIRSTLKDYTTNNAKTIILIATILFIISYSIYTLQHQKNLLITTLPFALFATIRYFLLTTSTNIKNTILARKPHKIIKDKHLTIDILIWIVLAITILYF